MAKGKSAQECGYSVRARRPRGAAPGSGFVDIDEADDREELSQIMRSYGFRSGGLADLMDVDEQRSLTRHVPRSSRPDDTDY